MKIKDYFHDLKQFNLIGNTVNNIKLKLKK